MAFSSAQVVQPLEIHIQTFGDFIESTFTIFWPASSIFHLFKISKFQSPQNRFNAEKFTRAYQNNKTALRGCMLQYVVRVTSTSNWISAIAAVAHVHDCC